MCSPSSQIVSLALPWAGFNHLEAMGLRSFIRAWGRLCSIWEAFPLLSLALAWGTSNQVFLHPQEPGGPEVGHSTDGSELVSVVGLYASRNT